MHGTEAQSLFQKYQRDFSHGCIRLEDPAKLAEWVLSKQPGWPPEKIRAAMEGTKLSVRVDLAEPLAVYIFYAMALVDLEGRIHFWDDVYGYDGTLEQALAQGYPYPP